MIQALHILLQKLEKYPDQGVITPLNESEIEQIERTLGKELPLFFKEYLRKIGLKQDVVWGVLEQVQDFDRLDDFLPEGTTSQFFRFGHNGGEDYWLLRYDEEQERAIYEYDYYNQFEIVKLDKTFDDLLWEAKEKLIKNTPKTNAQKEWCVQFSVNTGSGKFLVNQLKSSLTIELIREPKYVDTSEAGVKTFEGMLRIEGKDIALHKQIIQGDGSSSLYFDLEETVEVMQTDSLIKKIDEALEKSILKHVLIDYGILPKDDLK